MGATRTTSPSTDTETMAQNVRRACSTPSNWLPLRRVQPVVASKALQSRYVDGHKNSDWFVRFAADMESRDSTQSKIVLKFYLFLRDYLPDGLVGEYAHIDGNEVMHHLLCHAEHTASRHKVSRSVETSWGELEKWVGRGATWEEALKAKPVGRFKKSGPPAGLYPPAGVLSILILSHPDPDARFRAQIGRLQIDWMMQKREGLVVRSGFWKGVAETNLHTVFKPEEPRQADVPARRVLQHLGLLPVVRDRGREPARNEQRDEKEPWLRHGMVQGTPS